MAFTYKLKRNGGRYQIAAYRDGVEFLTVPAGPVMDSAIIDEAELKKRISTLDQQLKSAEKDKQGNAIVGPIDSFIGKEYTEAELGNT